MFPRVTLIVGGAASGKSNWAEALTTNYKKPKTYLATSQVLDDEMQVKITRHRTLRGAGWTTVESPLHAADVLTGLAHGHICLLDCATMWLSNHLLAGSDLETQQANLLTAIDTCAADLVIVSNEVGQGIVPDNALTRQFRDTQGRLNIALATRADLVVQVTVGLPNILKGQLPDILKDHLS